MLIKWMDRSCKRETNCVNVKHMYSRRCRGHHWLSSCNGPHQPTAIPGVDKGTSGVVVAAEDEAEEKERREDVRRERGKLEKTWQ